MTKKYLIESGVSGLVLGEYAADNEAAALDALARDAGYESHASIPEGVRDDDLVVTEIAADDDE